MVERDVGVMMDWKKVVQESRAVLNTSVNRRLASVRSVPGLDRRGVSGVPWRGILAPMTDAEADGVSLVLSRRSLGVGVEGCEISAEASDLAAACAFARVKNRMRKVYSAEALSSSTSCSDLYRPSRGICYRQHRHE